MMFDAKFILLSGDKNVPVPVLAKRKNVESFCRTELMVQAFDTLPAGDVIAAGQRCDEESAGSLGVGRWAPGAKLGIIETLPGSAMLAEPTHQTSFNVVGVAVRSATDISVAAQKSDWRDGQPSVGSTYLARFDGTRWHEVPWKHGGSITTLDTTGDRTLIVMTDRGELYMGSSLDALRSVPLPSVLQTDDTVPFVSSVWSPAAGNVWAIVEKRKRMQDGMPDPNTGGDGFLVHTRPATKPLPSVEEFEQKERAFRLPGPPVEWCQTPFVLLYTLGKKAPPDYDYPSTRDALRGHREFAVEGVEFIEFERMERRYFGARIPDFDLGKKLAKLVKDKVPGATPELVCHDPPAKRTLTVDLTAAANPAAAKTNAPTTAEQPRGDRR